MVCLETLIQPAVAGGTADIKFPVLIPVLASDLYSSPEQMYPYFISLATMKGGYVQRPVLCRQCRALRMARFG